MSESPTRILLIRHGTNDFVKNGLLAARTPGVHLNDEGRAQADALAHRFAETQIAALYASPLERTVETAEPLALRLGLELHILEDVLESDCGEWTGQKLDDLSKLENWKQVQVHPSAFRFPGGESFLQIQARMVAALEELRARHAGQTVAVVTHSDPIKLAVAYYAGMPLDMFQRLDVAPTSVSELDFSPLRTRLVRLNDCAHVPASRELAAELPTSAAQPVGGANVETD